MTAAYGRHQDILEPLHYLSLVEQRPGAFEHAQPLRQWRENWPPVYESMLAALRRQHTKRKSGHSRPSSRSCSCIRAMPQTWSKQRVEQALDEGLNQSVRCTLLSQSTVGSHARWYLHLTCRPDRNWPISDAKPAPLARYDQFLIGVADMSTPSTVHLEQQLKQLHLAALLRHYQTQAQSGHRRRLGL